MALNRLRFHNILVQEMDAPSVAATELAEVVDEGIQESQEGLLTAQEFRVQTADLRAQMAELRAEVHAEMTRLLKWLIGTGIVIGGAIIGLLITLIVQGI